MGTISSTGIMVLSTCLRIHCTVLSQDSISVVWWLFDGEVAIVIDVTYVGFVLDAIKLMLDAAPKFAIAMDRLVWLGAGHQLSTGTASAAGCGRPLSSTVVTQHNHVCHRSMWICSPMRTSTLTTLSDTVEHCCSVVATRA
jgi:hypothetical protein